jgi:hypothetical protein
MRRSSFSASKDELRRKNFERVMSISMSFSINRSEVREIWWAVFRCTNQVPTASGNRIQKPQCYRLKTSPLHSRSTVFLLRLLDFQHLSLSILWLKLSVRLISSIAGRDI